ncbi:unnamed protein product [Owenia fusiformis]|uniref:Uncharacterized protein n=1 Tax=Owenia fusiformis TaxID=6347 RepID=A0A8J1Y5K9_OWEFU|nr:unnamed protein product [Owenia fusiformis]
MPPKKAAAKPKQPRAPKGHQLAKPFPEGEILVDTIFKKRWRIGKPVGQGGFGVLYLGFEDGTPATEPPYVIKIEPHSNGPLFCELNFYQRAAKQDMIEEWRKRHKLKHVGVPRFISTGSHQRNGTNFRYLVMERFNGDLQQAFEKAGKRFPRKTVCMLAIRILTILEYIHDHEYVHADIKAANLLMGYAKGTTEQVYLVDYGLAYRYIPDKQHKQYKEDPKRCHDGTIEFTSIDAHKGAYPSRRGDIEVLGYCLLQWLCGRLPWESNLNNKEFVRDQKIKYMKNIPSLMSACFPEGEKPDEIQKYLEMTTKLEYTEKPDYNKLRSLFTTALKKMSTSDDGKFDFKAVKSPIKKSRKRKSAAGNDEMDSTKKRPTLKSPTRPTPEVRKSKSPVKKSTPSGKAKSPVKKSNPAKKAVSNGDVKSKKSTPVWPVGAVKSPIRSANKAAVPKTKVKKVGASVATQTSPWMKKAGKKQTKKAKE